MKGICLVSGGLDSSLSLIKLLDQGHSVVPLFVDYNQWSSAPEHEAFHIITDWCRKTFMDRVLDSAEIGISWQDDEGVGSVWGRGIALVGLASMWAYLNGNDYEFIALGNHKGDVGPDCKPGSFDDYLHNTLIEATKGQMDLILPIRTLDIETIGKELASYDKDLLRLTYSCYWAPPCGYKSQNDQYLCPGCRRKKLAMIAAGVGTPEQLSMPNCPERSYQSSLATKTGY